MSSVSEIAEIFEKITVRYDHQVPIGGRCESNVYYRVEELSEDDLDACANYVAERIVNVISPQSPEVLLKLPGGYTFFGERLSAMLTELIPGGEEIPLENYVERKLYNGHGEKYRGRNAILITDVITTARSSLEAHTKATLRGIPVLCWACLIDRTFGPGPVPVVSALTGAPVRVLSQVG